MGNPDAQVVHGAVKGNTVVKGNTLKDEDRQKCEIWSRVMGYHRPISSYNVGKKQEYAERKVFLEPHE